MRGAIQITRDLEDVIKAEMRDMESLPALGAISEDEYQRQLGRLEALKWVLQKAHAELDE